MALGCSPIETSSRNHRPIKYIIEIRSIIRKNKYEIVHVHGNSATMAVDLLGAYLGGVKNRIAHSHNSMCKHVIVDKLLRPLFTHLFTGAIACGNEAARWLFPGKNVLIVPVGINLELFKYKTPSRERIRKLLGISDETFVVGHIGSFNRVKNQSFILNVFDILYRTIPNSLLTLIGSGELFDYVLEQTKTLDCRNHIRFLGPLDHLSIPEYLCAMDVVIFPSLYEGFPVTVMECLASGLSILLSENITHEFLFANAVNYLSLDLPGDVWAYTLLEMKNYNRAQQCAESQNILKKMKYDVIDSVRVLEEFYSSL